MLLSSLSSAKRKWQTSKQCMFCTGYEWYHSPMFSPRGQGKLCCDLLLAVNIVTSYSDETCNVSFSLLPPLRLRSSLPSLTTSTDCLQWSALASYCIWLLVSPTCSLPVASCQASCNVHRSHICCSPTSCDLLSVDLLSSTLSSHYIGALQTCHVCRHSPGPSHQ